MKSAFFDRAPSGLLARFSRSLTEWLYSPILGEERAFAADVGPEEREAVRKQAQALADKRIKFLSRAVIWLAFSVFLLAAADLEAALVVGSLWGIWIAYQGFHALVAPDLRRRWLHDELRGRAEQSKSAERLAIEGRHARSLEELSASIAHEIRNPITAAKSLVQQINEDPTSAENTEYAKVALEELERVERSISHLLRYARDEELSLETIRVRDVVESALETFRDRLARSGVVIERDLESAPEIPADPEKLRRIVINLVSNALDALEEDGGTPGGRIVISSGWNLAATEAWLRVKDNGPGIPADRLEKIWSPFYTSKSRGTGLGLAITKKLVEAHGGTIEVASRECEGTEMVITLPVKRSAR